MTYRNKGKKPAIQQFEEIQMEFRENRIMPVYLMHGDDSYLPNQLQKILIEHAIAPDDQDFNLDIMYGDEVTAQTALSVCQMAPMMVERRIVIIRRFDRLKNNKLFALLAKQPNPAAVVLLLCDGKPRLNISPYNALNRNKKSVKVAEFPRLDKNQARTFARDHILKNGYQLENGVDGMLIDFLGNNLELIVNEIEKLITYVGDRDQKIITSQDVLQASGQTREINIFELQDAVIQRRAVDAHRISEQLLVRSSSRQGEALRIIAILSNFLIRVLKLHELKDKRLDRDTIAQKLEVAPNLLFKYYNATANWSLQDVHRAIQLLLSADCEIKGLSKRGPRLVITLLVTQLASEPLRQY
ncbi:MAG: DNA polymerase III subunit delta [Bacteroidetes bacterium]|nr:DNA polymerase III subunit delta [Bacteroidota bacterium]